MSSDCCCSRCRQNADGNGGHAWYLLALECPAEITASMDSAFQLTRPLDYHTLSEDHPRCN
ncbi:uncharacterized protein BO88DRAFT_57694 [Aspergillus vadensis CBS 113365]|uniref:Uncharacterized protein n=1 Tax=Aspergillus vadensis (strain CBS 113365 / IMI 142717 / IBT 24658) TaxID=1448311 RepID=A0A319B931_ASPVC|nr:hypothetical protein BO88DRAFT_57694 [Aspergillus vadensis CBS 113365]PYH68421.1 hypothetical protein BO88DRAFT_57694 [Aspergillus vadensis CBS 113365]